MPTYQIECHDCGTTREQKLTFSEYDEVSQGTKDLSCDSCGAKAYIVFSPGNLGFVMKEGESGGWASKALKENAYRKKRNKEMARREKDHVFKSKLQPNYNGTETGSWREAQELARRDKGAPSANTYAGYVSKETP